MGGDCLYLCVHCGIHQASMDNSKFVATEMALVRLRALPDRTSRNLRNRSIGEGGAGRSEKEGRADGGESIQCAVYTGMKVSNATLIDNNDNPFRCT